MGTLGALSGGASRFRKGVRLSLFLVRLSSLRPRKVCPKNEARIAGTLP